jgi:SAM-dependent methyltransferase
LIGDAQFARLAGAAAEPYRAMGGFAWRFARGKLRGDPVFRYLLSAALIAPGVRVLDLGCGQGLLAALLGAAGTLRPGAYRGIELMPRDVTRARRAIGADCGVEQGDIRRAVFGAADVVVILDVLHYLAPREQDAILAGARDALAAGGLLLLRIADDAAGLPYRLGMSIDWAVAWARGLGATRLYCRSVAQWRSALAALGFSVLAEPMSQGTPFANVLLIARMPKRP